MVKSVLDCKDIPKYMEIGKNDKFWYKQCEDNFIELFGADKLKLVCKVFAATSINTSLKANITLFRRALFQIENDLPFSNYLPNIKDQLGRIKKDEELSGRKINSFARAMSGDINAVIVDVWLLRAFGLSRKSMRYTGPHKGQMREGGASKRQYDMIESWVREEATKIGLEPRQLSSMIWAGVRIDTTNDRTTHYKELLTIKIKDLFHEKIN